MPIIIFVLSMFFSSESAITLKSAAGTTKETPKVTETPYDGREYIIYTDDMP